ncbi:MAG: recombination mediator RecR [Bacilli bacterium]|jgi:recombination protein RecR|nr:recombination mediator RecR [Bacillota bacterium]NLM31784.1 recombination protein RecR [Acholeplasmataceae bacterium]HOA78066.1 recombination mediator RecR [Bacilli bacterium]HPZ26608.1 recombination mediator RecR [Bacilli bacterium]HQC89082.1 recombination mediator RecR [Bacilli bacterium]
MKYPEALKRLIESFQMYPGIGPKTAERLAFFTFFKLKDEDIVRFSQSLLNLKTDVIYCSQCGVLTDRERCEICSDSDRRNTILVVESSRDVVAFEKTNQYDGRYHVLNGLISPLKGISPNEVNIKSLVNRVSSEAPGEVIIATAATVEGEMTAMYIKKQLENSNVKITRIGYGLPAGGDIEYADEITLVKSLEGRKDM